MKKSYVVIGMGRFGTSVAERLYELGNEVLAIDTNPDKVQRMESKVTCAVVADVRDEEVLRSLGARSCDCAVVAIGSDLATCIIATLNLKDLGVPQVICKATDELRKKALEKVGADRVVIPERETGIKLAQAITSSSILDFIELSKDCGIAEIPTPESWFGKTLRELNIRAKYGVNIIAIRHDGKIDVAPGRGSCVERTHGAGRPRNERQAGKAARMRQEHITSRQNPLLVHIRKLQASRSYRKASGEFAAEGTKLLEEAAKWYPGLHTVVCREGLRLCKLPEQVRVVTVPEDVFKSISTVDTPQGAIFLCRLPERQQADLTAGTLLLDGIQDPGNLGTMLRTADALGVPIALLDGCADPYSFKTVRASMGAVFRWTFPRSPRRSAGAARRKESYVNRYGAQ